jgi:hypothetical protein
MEVVRSGDHMVTHHMLQDYIQACILTTAAFAATFIVIVDESQIYNSRQHESLSLE